MTRNRLAILVLTSVATTGCLRKDTAHSLYLSPDGAVVWTAIERDVRSDETEVAKRQAEEQRYLAAARNNAHALGEGLAALSPSRLRTVIVRSEAPFVVVTEAAFDRIDRVFDRMLIESHTPGFATLTRTGTRTTLALHIDFSAAKTDDDSEPSPAAGLLDGLDRLRIVLTDGTFTSAAGFTLQDDGTSAVLTEIPESDAASHGLVYDLSLIWDTATPVTSSRRTSSDRSSR